ncbi:Cysteine desulfurase [Candidatus Bilamarchaeum dharawalense]|uniref:Cysteine desulfurase n=1 Tax=Candidatus Bilamarchaeum dharawalense TaxID=2885759 RepID=A0A5E4LN09_9ARCH|nr:Cysteine desulfurase [Candidatus Bilamarchaeum dharawalense]
MKEIKKDFPVLVNNPDIVYLDSACTSLKPMQVIEAEMEYYKKFGACAGRSSHRLGRETNQRLDECREKVAKFVNAEKDGLIWTRNATEGLNIVANGFDFSKRKKVVTSIVEHHSVLLPLIKLRDQGKIKLDVVGCDKEGNVDFSKIDRETALVVTNSWNNILGTGRKINEIAKLAHDNGALICVDGAQGVPHHKTDFKNLDFLCFSGHKMLAPTGIGALVCKTDHLAKLKPLMTGGGAVKTVELNKVVELPTQERFEAGIQHYAGIFGFASACEYLNKIGMEEVEKHEATLAKAFYEELKSAGAMIYGPDSPQNHSALYSFGFKNAKAHDIALMLDREKIAVRSGFFCAQPAMEVIGAGDGATRVSGYIYNTPEDAKRFGEILKKINVLYS